MAKTRKDSRGYALHTGETQRKDGRYVYTYTNIHGKRKSIYANSLTELRKKERKSIRDREDGLDPDAADHITLNQMFDKYYAQKYNLKETTRSNYKYMYDHFVRDTFGKRIISKIKYSDVKEFTVEKDESGVLHYKIPSLQGHGNAFSYYRSILFFLDSLINEEEKMI